MSDTQQQADAPDQPSEAEDVQQEQTFTQADVDRIVRERVQRERAKYADYDDLKTKAGEARTAEERMAELEKRYADAEAKALRSDIAARHGISAEDRDLFLTGTDEETLTTQAKRLAERDAEQKRNNNYAPSEGRTPTGINHSEEREFLSSLIQT